MLEWKPIDLTKTTFDVDPESFGGWSLDDEDLVLDHAEECYHIDLGRCSTSAEVLGWLGQVAHKVWATDALLAGLVRMLDKTVGLQGWDGQGRNRKMSKKALRAFVDSQIARYPGLPIRRDLRHD